MEGGQVRCNICGVMVGDGEAKDHASTPSHASLRSKLEQDLRQMSSENYSDDSSVVLQWSKSI